MRRTRPLIERIDSRREFRAICDRLAPQDPALTHEEWAQHAEEVEAICRRFGRPTSAREDGDFSVAGDWFRRREVCVEFLSCRIYAPKLLDALWDYVRSQEMPYAVFMDAVDPFFSLILGRDGGYLHYEYTPREFRREVAKDPGMAERIQWVYHLVRAKDATLKLM